MTDMNYECPIALPECLDISSLSPAAFDGMRINKYGLEAYISSDELKSGSGLLNMVLTDKRKNLKATIKALSDEIKLREDISKYLLGQVEDDISRQNADLMNLSVARLHYNLDLYMEVKDKKMKLENNMLDLEKEKRKEHLESWRDLMFLRKYLLSSLREYWDMSNKCRVLSSDIYGSHNHENSKGYRGYMQET